MQTLIDLLPAVLKGSIVLFMIGNLLGLGLAVRFGDAMKVLGDIRYAGYTFFWGFIAGPLLAFLVASLFQLSPPYAVGLELLGLVPGAPFLPMLVARARGSQPHTAAFLVLAIAATIVALPAIVPRTIIGAVADPWTIGKPLLLFLVAPVLAGAGLQMFSVGLANSLQPKVRTLTSVATAAVLLLCLVLYGGQFVSALGTFAIAAQAAFLVLTAAFAYFLSPGLAPGEKIVIALGMSTRNVGAAFAPLFAASGTDDRTFAMLALSVPLQLAVSFGAALLFRHGAAAAERPPGRG